MPKAQTTTSPNSNNGSPIASQRNTAGSAKILANYTRFLGEKGVIPSLQSLQSPQYQQLLNLAQQYVEYYAIRTVGFLNDYFGQPAESDDV